MQVPLRTRTSRPTPHPAWLLVVWLATGAACELPKRGLPATIWLGGDAGTTVDARRADAYPRDAVGDGPSSQSCRRTVFDLTRPEGEVVFVVDRSSIMSTSNVGQCPSCTTYWNSLKDAVSIVTGDPGDKLDFGLKLFPSTTAGNGCEVTTTMDVPVSSAGAQATASLLASSIPAGQAPLTLGLRSAVDYLGGRPSLVPQMIVLAMAGLPTCGGSDHTQDDSSLALDDVRRSAAMAIPVFVLAVGDVQPKLLSFAQMGGTTTTHSAYQPQVLLQDLRTYARQNAPCTYSLPGDVGPQASVSVYFDGVEIDGFFVDSAEPSVAFNSDVCNQLHSLTVSELAIEIACR
jgi:hypothetical protein